MKNNSYYIDLSSLSLEKEKIGDVSRGVLNTAANRIELQDLLRVGDTLTYNYATGYGSKNMTVIIEISKVEDITSSNTAENITTEALSAERPTAGAAGSTSDAVSGSEAGATTAAGNVNTPKTKDVAMPVWSVI